jgi:SAM-dependent methyltransferase
MERTRRDVPPLPLRAVGKALSWLIAGVPAAWPFLRGPTRRWWEAMASHWDDRIEPDRAEHLAPLISAAEALPAAPRQVLEIGTGTGSGAIALARLLPQAEVRGLDISSAMVRAAAAKAGRGLAGRVRFDVGDAGSLPYGDETFDLVAQLNVPVYFGEIRRVLAPGGWVIVGSSLGAVTPYHTPDWILRRRFERLGLRTLQTGRAARGTFYVAQRPGDLR